MNHLHIVSGALHAVRCARRSSTLSSQRRFIRLARDECEGVVTVIMRELGQPPDAQRMGQSKPGVTMVTLLTLLDAVEERLLSVKQPASLQNALKCAVEAFRMLAEVLEEQDSQDDSDGTATEPTRSGSSTNEGTDSEADSPTQAEIEEAEIGLAEAPRSWPRGSADGLIKDEVPGLIVDLMGRCTDAQTAQEALQMAECAVRSVHVTEHRVDARFLFQWFAQWVFLHMQNDFQGAAALLGKAFEDRDALRQCQFPDTLLCFLKIYRSHSFSQGANQQPEGSIERAHLADQANKELFDMLDYFNGCELDPFVQRVALECIGRSLLQKCRTAKPEFYYFHEAVRLATEPDDRANLVVNSCREIAKSLVRSSSLLALLGQLQGLEGPDLHLRTELRIRIERVRLCKLCNLGTDAAQEHELRQTVEKYVTMHGRSFPAPRDKAMQRMLVAPQDKDCGSATSMRTRTFLNRSQEAIGDRGTRVCDPPENEVPKQDTPQSSSGNGDPGVMSCEEAVSYVLGRPVPAPGTEPEPFHCALPPEPVEAGWQKLEDPQKRVKFVIFKERNTNRSTADMMRPGAKTTSALLEERMAWPAHLDPLNNAVQFLRGYRLEDFLLDSSADEKKRAHAMKHVVVHARAEAGSRPLTRETVRIVDENLNDLIVDIVGGRGGAKNKRPRLDMVEEDSYPSAGEDETDEGQMTPDTCCGPSSGSNSWEEPDCHFQGPVRKECLQDYSESSVNAQTVIRSQKSPLHLAFEASSASSGSTCTSVGEVDTAPATPDSLVFDNGEQEQVDSFGGTDCSEEDWERSERWPATPDPYD